TEVEARIPRGRHLAKRSARRAVRTDEGRRLPRARDVERGVHRERFRDELAALALLARRDADRPLVVEEACVRGPETTCASDGRLRSVDHSRAKERPRERVLRDDVTTNAVLLARKPKRLVGTLVLRREEERERSRIATAALGVDEGIRFGRPPRVSGCLAR